MTHHHHHHHQQQPCLSNLMPKMSVMCFCYPFSTNELCELITPSHYFKFRAIYSFKKNQPKVSFQFFFFLQRVPTWYLLLHTIIFIQSHILRRKMGSTTFKSYSVIILINVQINSQFGNPLMLKVVWLYPPFFLEGWGGGGGLCRFLPTYTGWGCRWRLMGTGARPRIQCRCWRSLGRRGSTGPAQLSGSSILPLPPLSELSTPTCNTHMFWESHTVSGVRRIFWREGGGGGWHFFPSQNFWVNFPDEVGVSIVHHQPLWQLASEPKKSFSGPKEGGGGGGTKQKRFRIQVGPSPWIRKLPPPPPPRVRACSQLYYFIYRR